MGHTSSEVKARYNKKAYDRVAFSIPKGEKEEWQSKAEKEGMSLTTFVRMKVNGEIRPSRSEVAEN